MDAFLQLRERLRIQTADICMSQRGSNSRKRNLRAFPTRKGGLAQVTLPRSHRSERRDLLHCGISARSELNDKFAVRHHDGVFHWVVESRAL
jgi:hypothetical protein